MSNNTQSLDLSEVKQSKDTKIYNKEKITFSLFKTCKESQKINDISINEYLKLISAPKFKHKFTDLRALPEAEYKTAKALQLQAITGSCIMNPEGRKEEHIQSLNGLCVADFDELPDSFNNWQDFKDALSKDAYSFILHYSASGRGLCMFLKIPTENDFQEIYLSLESYFEKTYGAKLDLLDDKTRLRFISYDEDYFFNPDSLIYTDTEKAVLKQIKIFKKVIINNNGETPAEALNNSGEQGLSLINNELNSRGYIITEGRGKTVYNYQRDAKANPKSLVAFYNKEVVLFRVHSRNAGFIKESYNLYELYKELNSFSDFEAAKKLNGLGFGYFFEKKEYPKEAILKNIENATDVNPVKWFNIYGKPNNIFGEEHEKIKDNISVTKIKANFKWNDTIKVLNKNPYKLPVNSVYTRFDFLVLWRFKNNWKEAFNFIEYELKKSDIPFVRIADKYFKILHKPNRRGFDEKKISVWGKEEVKADIPNQMHLIKKFDGFILEPDNITYRQNINGWFNLYSEFSHKPITGKITEKDISNSLGFLHHIFGEQYELGLKYMQILYLHPKQMLPILCLVSTERNTGKTTFLNWLEMIFGENTALISPHELAGDFNSSYITKNIITIDETTFEKSQTVEKLKSLVTAKNSTYSAKYIPNSQISTYCKVVLCTNKESSFMRIDSEEIRFWVRKINTIINLNTIIEDQLFKEIPYFLKYLLQLPKIDFSKSRMVFTKEEIKTDAGEVVKRESKSSLHKEIEIYFEDFFNESKLDMVEANPIDIKNRWFKHQNNVSINYIRSVIKDEMKQKSTELHRYTPFEDKSGKSKTGTPFVFERQNEPI